VLLSIHEDENQGLLALFSFRHKSWLDLLLDQLEVLVSVTCMHSFVRKWRYIICKQVLTDGNSVAINKAEIQFGNYADKLRSSNLCHTTCMSPSHMFRFIYL